MSDCRSRAASLATLVSGCSHGGGICMLALGKLAEAKQRLEAALTYDDHRADTRVRPSLGPSCRRPRPQLECHPHPCIHPRAHQVQLAMVLYGLGKPQHSLVELNRSLEIEPRCAYPPAHPPAHLPLISDRSPTHLPLISDPSPLSGLALLYGFGRSFTARGSTCMQPSKTTLKSSSRPTPASMITSGLTLVSTATFA